jgi:hypothetical protein
VEEMDWALSPVKSNFSSVGFTGCHGNVQTKEAFLILFTMEGVNIWVIRQCIYIFVNSLKIFTFPDSLQFRNENQKSLLFTRFSLQGAV